MPAKAGIQFLAKFWVPASAGTSGNVMLSLDFTDTLVDFLRQWGEMNPAAVVVLTLVFVFGGLTPIPRTFLTLAAGIVYGMAAIPVIIPATTAGCLLVFLLVRYLFGGWVWRIVERRPKLLAIMDAVNAEGWRIVGLCRLASPIPSMIQNTIFGLTRIGVWPFTWATFVFTIPQVVLYVYLGSIGRAALLGESSGVNLAIMAAGGLTLLITVLLIMRRVRASMRTLERAATAASPQASV
jgi:uncharacterized membrane protein YdjX (TVP38/TMEM64 family)